MFLRYPLSCLSYCFELAVSFATRFKLAQPKIAACLAGGGTKCWKRVARCTNTLQHPRSSPVSQFIFQSTQSLGTGCRPTGIPAPQCQPTYRNMATPWVCGDCAGTVFVEDRSAGDIICKVLVHHLMPASVCTVVPRERVALMLDTCLCPAEVWPSCRVSRHR